MDILNIERNEIAKYQKLYNYTEEFRNKTILLTGGKGLVGQGIIKWLLWDNEVHKANTRLIVSTRKPDKVPGYITLNDHITFCKFGEEKKAVADIKIDFIIHAASPTGNSFHKMNPVESSRVIVDETEKILEICKDNPGCSMIYLSSEEIYGLPDFEEPITEKYVGAVDSLNIRSCYPLSKKMAELLCYSYAVEYGTDVKIIRPTVIHGLFQQYEEQRVVNEILRCILENKNLVMKSKGLTKKCMMYSLDAISAVFTVLIKGEKGEAYNASNPETFMTVKDMANYVFEKFNPNIKVEYAESDTSVSLGYLPRRSLVQDITKLKSLGWEPIGGIEHIYEVDIARFISSGIIS